jgi:hypoxanthine phosphoribosyltransferase
VNPPFAHASEAEMSRILDFYAVRWEYEPHTFPILWNLEGDVVESFSPDFYLPDLDLYLEMTTLRQKLVRKKNRKLRRLRELYPDLNVKLFYARDFRALMLKYGKLALADALSGTPGQVPSPYGAALELDAADAADAAVALADAAAVAAVLASGTPAGSPVVAADPATDIDRTTRRRRRAADPRPVGDEPAIRQ